jgi:MtrB/PioB family decaheme-associated outer membrane protein
MKTSTQQVGCRMTILALALLAAFGPARADDDLAQYTKPESMISAGVGAVSGDSNDRALFGQYNGMRKNDVFALVDIDYARRDEETGTWTILQGLNLGLDTRELRFTRQKQGDWKYFAEYSELTRNYPRTVNTGLTGAGTATPTVTRLSAQGAGNDLNLKTERKSAALGYEKWITSQLQFEVAFKHEDKDGARLFGRGLNCAGNATASIPCLPGAAGSGAILLLPEPIDFTTRQIDAKLNFSGDKFLVTGAYYGSFFTNANGSLRPTINGNLYNPNGTTINTAAGAGRALAGYLQLPMALAPDNQAHQMSLSGFYAFTPSTRATFKYAYTRATQDENFADMGLTVMPAGVTSLHGRVDTTLIQAGVTSRPIDKLSLTANTRYEDRDNKTPDELYSPTVGFTNEQSSLKKLNSKLEASYRLSPAYRATVGAELENIDRGVPVSTYIPGGINLLRQKTDEISYRAELRRSMSETLNGSISYIHSERDGSEWLNAIAGTPEVTDAVAAALGNGRPVTPVMFMDRTRDKVKLSADWSPIERMSLQFTAENYRDAYDAPSNGVRKGLRGNGGNLYGIDASFTLSEDWKLSTYVTRSEQNQQINHSLYMANLVSRSDAAGLAITGKASSKLDVGADLSYINDNNQYRQALETTSNTAATITTNTAFLNAQGGLPDVTYRATTLKLFGKYALTKNSGVRLDLVHMRALLNEWTWGNNGVPFFYSDWTTVSMQPTQHVTYIGVAYQYRFH